VGVEQLELRNLLEHDFVPGTERFEQVHAWIGSKQMVGGA
jgi:hypothetical protein